MFDIKKYISGIFVGSMLITSANAQVFDFDYSEDIYFKLYTGIHDTEDSSYSEGASFDNGSINVQADLGFDSGFTIGGILGYPLFNPETSFFGNIRGELDASYEKAYLDDVEFDASATWTRADTTTIAFATGSLEANGKLEVLNFYNNFIYHSKQISAIQPYFGLGAGFSYSELNIEDIIGEVIGTQDRYTSVGVQFVLGADLLTFNNFSGGARVVGRRINNTEEQISSREVISGHFDLRYNF